MKERPIIFNSHGVRAILAGRKTQARRIINPIPIWIGYPNVPFKTPDANPKGIIKCPFGERGGRLWVRETFAQQYNHDDAGIYVYRADMDCPPPRYGKWCPSIHMSRNESRITLEVTGVRVERLQDISESDAIAEGLIRYGEGFRYAPDFPWFANPVAAFRSGWDKQNRPATWAGNWWVWVIEFRRVEP